MDKQYNEIKRLAKYIPGFLHLDKQEQSIAINDAALIFWQKYPEYIGDIEYDKYKNIMFMIIRSMVNRRFHFNSANKRNFLFEAIQPEFLEEILIYEEYDEIPLPDISQYKHNRILIDKCQGMTYNQLSLKYNITYKQVESRLRNLKKKLKIHFKDTVYL